MQCLCHALCSVKAGWWALASPAAAPLQHHRVAKAAAASAASAGRGQAPGVLQAGNAEVSCASVSTALAVYITRVGI